MIVLLGYYISIGVMTLFLMYLRDDQRHLYVPVLNFIAIALWPLWWVIIVCWRIEQGFYKMVEYNDKVRSLKKDRSK